MPPALEPCTLALAALMLTAAVWTVAGASTRSATRRNAFGINHRAPAPAALALATDAATPRGRQPGSGVLRHMRICTRAARFHSRDRALRPPPLLPRAAIFASMPPITHTRPLALLPQAREPPLRR